MRRSETTEDSQQCMYRDGTLIMSSLPMPMHSIKQIIREEEAAEEQDEKTTNKEHASSSHGLKQTNQTQSRKKDSSSNKEDTGGESQSKAKLSQKSSSDPNTHPNKSSKYVDSEVLCETPLQDNQSFKLTNKSDLHRPQSQKQASRYSQGKLDDDFCA